MPARNTAKAQWWDRVAISVMARLPGAIAAEAAGELSLDPDAETTRPRYRYRGLAWTVAPVGWADRA
jgi:hypothetical protein